MISSFSDMLLPIIGFFRLFNLYIGESMPIIRPKDINIISHYQYSFSLILNNFKCLFWGKLVVISLGMEKMNVCGLMIGISNFEKGIETARMNIYFFSGEVTPLINSHNSMVTSPKASGILK